MKGFTRWYINTLNGKMETEYKSLDFRLKKVYETTN